MNGGCDDEGAVEGLSVACGKRLGRFLGGISSWTSDLRGNLYTCAILVSSMATDRQTEVLPLVLYCCRTQV